MTTSQVALVLSIAKGEVGTHETRANGHWVNDSKYNKWFGKIPGYPRDGYDYPWCAVFVSWCADKAGQKNLYPRTASCLTAVNWFKNKGRFSEYPAIGAQIFYGSGGASHTGIVYKFDATYVYTYEGNTNTNGSAEGDGVYDRKRTRRDSYVYGYGYPEFDDLVTADPSKKGKKGFSYKASASAPAAPAKTPEKPASSSGTYTVKEGDTLSAIGEKLGIGWQFLATLNGLKGPYTLTPGQVLKVKAATINKPVSYEPWPGYAFFKTYPNDPRITRMGKRLVAEGCSAYSSGPGPQFTESDRKSCRKWQLKLGYRGTDADGWLGKVSWDKLKVPRA
ncbi:peptidoglycan-binding protein [Streptomyces sp. NPDC058369]|uniref:peptidoglycan-binding protein n=1 Tax=Streptomyces sp. NPDC058369 TaxID=3346462 RepID=UPI0036635ACB